MTEIKRLSPAAAWMNIRDTPNAVLIDVRAKLEFSYVGHPTNAVNIPWKEWPNWQPDPDFLRNIQSVCSDLDNPIFLLCRTGQRSLEAAQVLADAGYRNLSNIEEGFEGPLDDQKHRSSRGGWRFHGLPWEQS